MTHVARPTASSESARVVWSPAPSMPASEAFCRISVSAHTSTIELATAQFRRKN